MGGIGNNNEFVETEVESRGFGSVGRGEAFVAWEEVGRRMGCVGQVVVLRGRVLEVGEKVPCRIWRMWRGGRVRLVVCRQMS